MIEIVTPGPMTTVQDRGRTGYAALGVPRSGAFDRDAAALANRLVGNDADAALLEVTLGGLVLRTMDAATLALTGAVCSGPFDWGRAVTVAAATTLRLGSPRDGLRSYLAVRGGIAVDSVLGSRSTDTLSGLGPRRLRDGDLLAVGPAGRQPVSGAVAVPRGGGEGLCIHPGPREDWFTAAARSQLTAAVWTVQADSDRVGIRFDGPALERAWMGELPSEATRPGALQVPADGRPILFGPDAPVTGGYPVIAVACNDGLDVAAQLRPGDEVTFSSGMGGTRPTQGPRQRRQPGS